MRFTISKLLVSLLFACPLAAGATTITAGPLTFGSNIPLYVDDIGACCGGYIVQLDTGVLFGGTGPQVASSNTTATFSFDLAKGWKITGLLWHTSLDYGYVGYPDDVGPTWAYAFGQKLTLCSAVGGCSSGSLTSGAGQYPLPAINFNAVTSSGTGTYQVIEYAKDAQFGDYSGSTATIFLEQTPVPEPASLALTATGVLAGIGVLKRKLVRG